MKDAASYILTEVQEALGSLDNNIHEAVVNALISAKTIFVYGVGRSGLVGKAFSVRLVQLGLDVHFVGDTTTPIVEKDDVVLIISNTGETMSAVQTANIVGRIGATVITITSNKLTKLGRASDILVEIAPRRKEENSRLAPLGTVFEDASFLFLDSLVPIMMQTLDQTESTMRKRHAIWV